jgi:hypothetical protein
MKVQRDGRSFTVDVCADGEGLVSHAGSATRTQIAQRGSAMPGTRAPARHGKQYLLCLTAERCREGTWHRGA